MPSETVGVLQIVRRRAATAVAMKCPTIKQAGVKDERNATAFLMLLPFHTTRPEHNQWAAARPAPAARATLECERNRQKIKQKT
jgi:hypothetical protein